MTPLRSQEIRLRPLHRLPDHLGRTKAGSSPTEIAARTLPEDRLYPGGLARRISYWRQVVKSHGGTAYAFAAGIFTQNLGRAHRLTKKIRAGVVWVNTYRAVSPIVPFGGNGYTGHGRESGLDSIRDYTRTKAIWINTSDAPMADPFVMR